jgi:hypothetical protein
MRTKAELLLYNAASKSLLLGGLTWSTFLVLLSWESHLIQSDFLATVPITCLMGVFMYLIMSPLLTIERQQFELAKMVWQSRSEDYLLLKLVGGIDLPFRLFCLLSGTVTTLFSLLSIYFLFTNSSPVIPIVSGTAFSLLVIILRAAANSWVLVGVAILLAAGVAGDMILMRKLYHRLQCLAETSEEEELRFNSLNKLITIELYRRRFTQANHYGVKLLSMAESMK